MSHYLTTDDKYRDLLYGDDYRAYLMARSQSAGGYRFGRTRTTRAAVRAHGALGRLKGTFKRMIEAIADAKLRRMQRELELRGIRYDRSNDEWVAPKFRPNER